MGFGGDGHPRRYWNAGPGAADLPLLVKSGVMGTGEIRRDRDGMWSEFYESVAQRLAPTSRGLSRDVIGKLQIVLLTMFAGYLVAAVYYYWQAVYLGNKYPLNTFLCVPEARFSDYDNMILMCRNLDPYHDHSRSGYPPLANLFYYLFSVLPEGRGFALYIAVPILFMMGTTYRHLSGLPVFYGIAASFALFVCSFPVLFAIDRGNLELWMMLASGVFLLLYDAPGSLARDLSCFALAAAIALKIYPFLFLLILLKDRRFTDFLKVLVLTGILTFLAASSFRFGALGAIADFRGMIAETDSLVKGTIVYARNNVGIYYAVVIVLKKLGFDDATEAFSSLYWIVAAAIMLIYGSIIASSRLRLWSCAACLTILMCLTPTLSNDYRMVQLLVPILLMLGSETPRTLPYRAICIIYALLLVPKNYWLLFPTYSPGDVGIASVINPALLFILLNLILFAERSQPAIRLTPLPRADGALGAVL
jgi:hypothetical protein